MPDPRVDAEEVYPVWPKDRPFPLTPMEAWYVLQGYAVKPAGGITAEQFARLPGKLGLADGRVMLRQS